MYCGGICLLLGTCKLFSGSFICLSFVVWFFIVLLLLLCDIHYNSHRHLPSGKA